MIWSVHCWLWSSSVNLAANSHRALTNLFALMALCEENPSIIGIFPMDSHQKEPATLAFDAFVDVRLNIEQMVVLSVIWDAMLLIWRHYNGCFYPSRCLPGIEVWLELNCDFPLRPIRPWRHNPRDRVSNHQPHDCILNRLFGRRSKKISKLRWPVNSLHKGPVTRKSFPFDDVIMLTATRWEISGFVWGMLSTVRRIIFPLTFHGIL